MDEASYLQFCGYHQYSTARSLLGYAERVSRRRRTCMFPVPVWLAVVVVITVAGCTRSPAQVSRGRGRARSSTAAVSASGQAVASSACALFRTAVFPVVKAQVQAGDLAPLIRLEEGEPVDAGGPVDPHAPYLRLVADADAIAAGHVHLRELADLLSKLSLTIQQASPSGGLVAVGQAAQAFADQCAAFGD
jgi:hypothetical protein